MVAYPNLKAHRASRSITQKDIASSILKVGEVTYNLKENGKKQFSLSEAKKLADFFGVTIDELFFANK